MNGREWQGILQRHGQPVTLLAETGESVEARAFLQPLLDRRGEGAPPTSLGLEQEERFLYLGPEQVPLTGIRYLRWQGVRYAIVSAHRLRGAGGHWWAVLRPMESVGL